MMVRNLHIDLPAEEIAEFCRRWRITELSLFGSVLRDDFKPDSDVDMLVRFSPGAGWSLLDFVRMQQQLQTLIGRDVDLVERSSVESSENYIRRQHILATAETVYAEG